MPTTYKNLALLMLCCLLYSCKSLQRISARDASENKASSTSKKKKTNLQFIDDIAITGGNNSSQIHEPSNTHSSKKKKENPLVTYAPPTDVSSTNFNIENATGIQFKYAVLLDASVEILSNVLLLQNMDHWWGTKYNYGGSTENGIDCSAFTQIMMRDVYKITIPRTARSQYDNSSRIGLDELQQGDLIFFQTIGRDISHVGIYLTNNKFVHAATSGGVMISDLNEMYWRNKYKGAGRVLKSLSIFSVK